MKNITRVEKQIGRHKLILETGHIATQAAGACTVRYGDTVVMSAVATGPPRPGIDFFPLMCDYRERAAAAGKFPGGFRKREGAPTMKETLTARLIDRPIRPSFVEGFNDEVQIQNFVMASDRQNDGDILAMNGATTALGVSHLPFLGPLASVRIGEIDGKFIALPTHDELEESELDLIVSGTKDVVLMIEGFAREMPEDRMAEAIQFAHQVIGEICDLQQELIDKAGKPKMEVEAVVESEFVAALKSEFTTALSDARKTDGKQARSDAVHQVKESALAKLVPDADGEGAARVSEFKKAWSAFFSGFVRDEILAGRRSDGRDNNTLRSLECDVDIFPSVHGSALFRRGETQAMVTITLGTGRDEQRVDGLFEEYTKKFMLDYNFPSFSVGECRPIRGPGRREIGHGALAERSVNPVLPDPDVFPYTIRVISDILESNGSSSMASVCCATLALMASGVPITNPVAGISIGLVKDGDSHVLLTDILGEEDHYGDMDFKIAGTQNGITGIQLDLKTNGISEQIIRETFTQSREARMEILRAMLSAISRPRESTASTAPRLLRTKIPVDKIGLLIGPGGKTIRGMQEELSVNIDVEDDGTVTVAGSDEASANAAFERIEAMTAAVQVGRIYQGRVTSVKDFGAFVEILPGRDGLCHISELADDYVANVADICKVGDTLSVKVIAVDDQDRVKLSRKVAMQEMGETKASPEKETAKQD